MNTENKNDLEKDIAEKLGRKLSIQEKASLENDALFLAQFTLKKIEELETRINKLEK
jgi:hypothetical protein